MKRLLIISHLFCLFTFGQTYKNPVTLFCYDNLTVKSIELQSVIVDDNFTELVIKYQNSKYENGWFSIDKNSYLIDYETKRKYYLKKVKNIKISPEESHLDLGKETVFSLYFEKIPKDCKRFHFIENEQINNGFKIQNIALDISRKDYDPYLKELRTYLPELVLVYLSDGISWVDFEEMYFHVKKETVGDSDYKNFSISDKIYDKKNNLELLFYSFDVGESTFKFQKNITSDKNRIIFIDFESEYVLNRVLMCFEKVFRLNQIETGLYSFPQRDFDMISIINGKSISYISFH